MDSILQFRKQKLTTQQKSRYYMWLGNWKQALEALTTWFNKNWSNCNKLLLMGDCLSTPELDFHLSNNEGEATPPEPKFNILEIPTPDNESIFLFIRYITLPDDPFRSQDPFYFLPRDIIILILNEFDSHTLFLLRLVSRRWRTTVSQYWFLFLYITDLLNSKWIYDPWRSTIIKS